MYNGRFLNTLQLTFNYTMDRNKHLVSLHIFMFVLTCRALDTIE